MYTNAPRRADRYAALDSMVTFGPVALLIAVPEFAVRAYGRPIADYIKVWEAHLEPLFRDVESPEGERRLVITLAPNGRSRHWLVDAAGGDLTEESAFVAPWRRQ